MNPMAYCFHKRFLPRGFFPPQPGFDSPAGEGRLASYPKYREQRRKWRTARKLTVTFKFARTRRKLAKQAKLLAAQKRNQELASLIETTGAAA